MAINNFFSPPEYLPFGAEDEFARPAAAIDALLCPNSHEMKAAPFAGGTSRGDLHRAIPDMHPIYRYPAANDLGPFSTFCFWVRRIPGPPYVILGMVAVRPHF